MFRRLLIATLFTAAVVSPAFAAKEWYDLYRDGLSQARRGQCAEAVKSFQAAVKLKPASGLNERTYGMDFVDAYLPYYQQGVCQLQMGDHTTALLMFNIEEKQGAIKKVDAVFRDLLKKRQDAEARAQKESDENDQRRRARLALEEVNRLRKEGEELHREGKVEEALARLTEAQKGAELLGDTSIQQQVAEKLKTIRAEQREKQEQADRSQRIERALGEGQRLLDAGQPAEARLRFDEVLALVPGHAAAAEGKRLAEERALALTTRQQREEARLQGKALVEQGQYEQALAPLAYAAADPSDIEARTLLERAQKTMERLRQQKDLRLSIDSLLAEGEQLLSGRKYSAAMVKLTSALELDGGNVRAQELLRLAERLTGDTLFNRIFPNQEPEIALFDTPPADWEDTRLTLRGMATDDRGLTRLEYRLDGRVVAEETLQPGRESAEYPKTYKVEHEFALEPGANQISVSAVDSGALTRVRTYTVTRRLRFYETKAFWPSAAAGAVGLLGVAVASQRLRRRRALRRRFNPYIAGAPVLDDDMFFGRRKLLARIMNVLHHNSLMITGERRIGKTTFLYHLKKQLEADEAGDYRFFPVFIDLQGVSEDDFFHSLMADVVETLLPTPATQELLRFKAEEGQAYDGRDFSHDLQRMVEELKTRTSRQVKLVLLIDEVDVLNEFSERVNQRLRSIFMKTFSEHLVAVMSGVGIKRIWTSEGSPWYNFFDEIELSAFSREEAEALIREPVNGVFRFQPEAAEHILELSTLKPYLVQKFCIHSVNRMLEEGRTTITAEDVQAVRDTVLFETEPEPALHQVPA